jgi:hypothetical protein
MAQPSSPFDPLSMWRDFVSQWEKGSNEMGNQAMASDPFRQGLHGGMNASLQVQKALGEMMAKFLTSLNLPTRDDVVALGDRLESIDGHLGQIARLLEGREGGAGASSATSANAITRPPRTRQPSRPTVEVAPPATTPAPVKAAAKKKSARSRK